MELVNIERYYQLLSYWIKNTHSSAVPSKDEIVLRGVLCIFSWLLWITFVLIAMEKDYQINNL